MDRVLGILYLPFGNNWWQSDIAVILLVDDI